MAPQWSPPNDYENRPICVLGGGVLGRRIAACFVAAGHQVRIRDPSEKSRDDAVKYIKENISSFTSLLPSQPKREGSVEAIEDLAAAVKDCWMVFEAVPEILPLKESTFADLEKHAPSDCILATNSSSFKSGELLSKVKDDKYPSATTLDLLEDLLTPSELPAYAGVLMEKIAADEHPSASLMKRLVSLTS